MDTTVIYGPGTWNLEAFYDDPRRPVLLDWLRANDIDPKGLPVEQCISVDVGEGGSVIRYVRYVTSPDGSKLATRDGHLLYEAHAAPLTVKPPEALLPAPCAAGSASPGGLTDNAPTEPSEKHREPPHDAESPEGVNTR